MARILFLQFYILYKNLGFLNIENKNLLSVVYLPFIVSKLFAPQTKCLKAEKEVTEFHGLRMKTFARGHLICTAVARGFKKKRIKTGRCLEKRMV